MAYKKSGKRGNSRSFYKKNKSRIVNDFLELAAKELKEVEDKIIKDVLKEGVGQSKVVPFSRPFFEKNKTDLEQNFWV